MSFRSLFLRLLLLLVASQAMASWSVVKSSDEELVLHWKRKGPGSPPGPGTWLLSLPGPGPVALNMDSIVTSPGIGSAEKVTGLIYRLSAPQRFRDLWVSSLEWNAQASAGLLEARLRLDMSRARTEAAGRRTFAASQNHPLERVLQNMLLNYAQSRGFRSLDADALAKVAIKSPLPAQRLLVRTRDESIHVITREELAKSGLPLHRIDPRRLRLYHQGVEQPIYVEGENNGRFDAGDFIEFIGKRALRENDRPHFYDSHATSLLVWDMPGLGLRAPLSPVSNRLEPTVHQAAFFHARVHLEKDEEILRIGSAAEEDVEDLGSDVSQQELKDFWYWTRQGASRDLLVVPFELAYHPARGFENLSAVISLKGITNHLKAAPDHHVKFLMNDIDISTENGRDNHAVWEGQETHEWKSGKLDPEVLKPGMNTLTLEKIHDLRTTSGEPVEFQDAFLNYVRLEFPAAFRAVNNQLRFSNAFPDSLGWQRFEIKGFRDDDLVLWDEAGRRLNGFDVTGRVPSHNLIFSDSLAHETRYQAMRISDRSVPVLLLDTLSDLLSPENGADYIIITHKSLRGPALDSLANHQRDRGLRTIIVFVEHLYQLFGDGSMDPAAMRAFLKHAYRWWKPPAPTYVLLLGDASLWFDKKQGAFQKTLVPTQLVNIPGWGVTSNDDYFAKVAGNDDLPDLITGRIPVSSASELSPVVHKLIRLEKERVAGHWQNKSLVISGYESDFMETIADLQSISVGNQRQFSRIDLFPGSPLYRPRDVDILFPAQMDSAFGSVLFFGHGGGAVWSDAGILTLDALDGNLLKGDHPVPAIFSITCLTGYFEDIAARSLGEEMLRRPRNGAAAFYGASGYISNRAGDLLSRELMELASTRSGMSVGQMVHEAEMRIRLKTGNAYLPVLAEFDLLGDPAMGMAVPEAKGQLSLTPATKATGPMLQVHGLGLGLDAGQGVLSLYLEDSVLSERSVTMAAGAFSLALDPGPLPPGKQGTALLHYWNDTISYRASGSFSTVDWLIDSLIVSPSKPGLGRRVSLSARLSTAYDNIRIVGGVALYGIGSREGPTTLEYQVPLDASTPSGWLRSRDSILLNLPAGETPVEPELRVSIRLSLEVLGPGGVVEKQIPNVDSRIHTVSLTAPSNLAFPSDAFELIPSTDPSLRIRFQNRGLGPDSVFGVLLEEVGGSWTDTLTYLKVLAAGRVDSLTALLPGRLLESELRASLRSWQGLEVDLSDNSTVIRLSWDSEKLVNPADSLYVPGSSLKMTRQRRGEATRVYLKADSLHDLPAHLKPARALDGSAMAYRILVSDTSGDIRLSMGFTPDHSEGLPASPRWHFQAEAPHGWVKLDSLSGENPGRVASRVERDGLYALLYNLDASPPQLQIMVRGKRLLPDDYVPLNTPVELVLQDGQGIDLLNRPPQLTSKKQSLDSGSLHIESSQGLPKLTRLRFLPEKSADNDTLTLVAHDISGNTVNHSFAIRMGDRLGIQALGAYPNPFADTTVFVFRLTDYSDEVLLQVFSRAGRPVRSFRLRGVVGYQEVVWDGRDSRGLRIANGLYYLKATARNRDARVKSYFKLYKLRRQ